jgi:hypothetical protein
LTTQANAQYIEQLSASISHNMKEKNTLFIYGHQPLFYYLTKNPPPIKTFWLQNNVIQVEDLFISIHASIQTTAKWPMVVNTKENVLGEKGEATLAEFLNTNDYIKIEETPNFEIWNRIEN